MATKWSVFQSDAVMIIYYEREFVRKLDWIVECWLYCNSAQNYAFITSDAYVYEIASKMRGAMFLLMKYNWRMQKYMADMLEEEHPFINLSPDFRFPLFIQWDLFFLVWTVFLRGAFTNHINIIICFLLLITIFIICIVFS